MTDLAVFESITLAIVAGIIIFVGILAVASWWLGRGSEPEDEIREGRRERES